MKRRDDLLKGPMEKAIEAVEKGEKKEEAIRQIKELYDDFHPLHDRYSEWCTSLLTFIGEHLGEEAVLKATERLMDEIYTERFRQLKNLDYRSLVEAFVRMHRSHYSQFHVEEDEEKTIITITGCGCGGRMMKEGKYDNTNRHPVMWGTTKKAYPWSYHKKGMPYYCIHSYVMNDIFQKVGVPVETKYGFQYDHGGNPIDDPCTYTIYKKRKGAQ